MKITLFILLFITIHSKKKFRLSHKDSYNANKSQAALTQQPVSQQQSSQSQSNSNVQIDVKNESELDKRLRAMEMDGIESRTTNLQRKLRRKKFFGGTGLLTRIADIGGKMIDKFAATGAGKWLSRLKMPQSIINKASKIGNSYLFQKGAKYGNVFMAKYGDDLLARSKDIANFGVKFYQKNGMHVDRLALDFYNRAMKPAEDINSKKDNIILVPVITPVLQGSSGIKEYPQTVQGQTQYPLIPPITDAETMQQQAKEEEEKMKKEQEDESSKKRLKKKTKSKK